MNTRPSLAARLVVVVAAAATTAMCLVPASGQPAATPGFTAAPAALAGHGELAVISSHRLYLVGSAANGTRRVALPGRATGPVWSHDGRWLAVESTAAGRHSVYLVAADGSTSRRLIGPVADLGALSWAPRGHLLAVRFATGQGGQRREVAATVTTAGVVRVLASSQVVTGPVWSPLGRSLALATDRFSSGWVSTLEVVAAEGGSVRRVVREQGSVYDLAGWWPDGTGLLAWQDYQGSASLAADGVPLLDIRLSDGARHRLARTMLEYPQWLAGSAARHRVAFVAGGDRELTAGHKHIEVCTKRHCHAVAQSFGAVSFEPAWTARGRLSLVRDRAVPVSNGSFGMTYVEAVQNSGSVLVQRAGRLDATAAGRGATAPEWGTAGALLVVRGRALWLATATQARRVAGPITVPSNYYGFVPWTSSYAWTRAVPQG